MKREKDRLQRVMVIGATPAGVIAANKLGELGIPVTLVDTEADLDRKFSSDQWQLASGVRFNFAHRPGLIRILRNPGIRLFMPAEVTSIKHSTQGFAVRLQPLQTFVDPEKCTLCGRCMEVCPVTVDGTKAVSFASRSSLPGRAIIEKCKTPPCQEKCPLGVNAQGYIALAGAGKYAEALELIRQENVLPGICGRVCTHPCEAACRRSDIDEPLAIRDLKRFITDTASPSETSAATPAARAARKEERVAVIGSGPAGLAAAAELSRHGCEVTVYEREKHPGGLLRYGIGQYRLPPEILDRDIAFIKSLGVTFVTGHAVDLDLGLGGLLKKFGSVIVATGTWLDRRLGVPGEDLEGVEGCLSFLNKLYRDGIKEVQGNVAVVGDGNSAFDLARALTRLGAEVTIVSWFAKDNIPADTEEIDGAIAEGVIIKDSLRVTEFLGRGNRLEKLHCVPTIPGPADDKGIAWPVRDPGKKPVALAFDRAFVAIGQAGPMRDSGAHGMPQVSKQGYLQVNDSMRTSSTHIFAAGDAVSGPTSVVEAMASGRTAARAVLQEIAGKSTVDSALLRPQGKEYRPFSEAVQKLSRQRMDELAPEVRRTTFLEVAKGLSADQAEKEAQRCLQCGLCSQCLQCIDACGRIGAVNHAEPLREAVENAGVVILADPSAARRIAGEDVIRAYDAKSSGSDTNSLVVRGYAAAAKAMMLLGGKSQRPKGHGVSFSPPDPGLSPEIKTGVFVCRCNDSLGWLDAMSDYIGALSADKGIVHAEVLNAACVAEGATAILRAIREKGITRAVLASCACCSLNFVCSSCTDQRSRLKVALFAGTGVSRSMVEMCNLRGEVLRMTRKEPATALARFKQLIDSSIERARMLKPLPAPARNYNFTTAVIGDSEAAIQSAQVLANAGLEVFWFNAAEDQSAAGHANIHSFRDAQVTGVRGMLGDFQVLFQQAGAEQFIQAGAVIMSRNAAERIKYVHQKELPGRDITSCMQQAGLVGVPFMYPGTTSVSGLYIADPAGIKVSNRDKGAAAAVLAAASMPRGPRSSRGFTVVVNESLCRGCGRCYNHCPYQAISYKKNSAGGWTAAVDDALCKGCGNCISVCPSNAADSPYRNHVFLEMALEEALI